MLPIQQLEIERQKTERQRLITEQAEFRGRVTVAVVAIIGVTCIVVTGLVGLVSV